VKNKPVALLLLSPQQAGGVLRKSKYISHLKAWNRRCLQRRILLRNKKYIKIWFPYLNLD
jgi:hypothetical protein